MSFTYDALGRVKDQVQPLGTVSSSWDAAGRRTGITYPDGFSLTQTFYTTGELAQVTENGSPSVSPASYDYDDLGRRKADHLGDATTVSYGYDAVSRLISLTHDLAGSADDLTLGFGYNPAGQIVQNTRSNDAYAWTGHGNGTTSRTFNGRNQISSTGFAYDGRGNLTSDGSTSYGYTSENLMTNAGGVTTEHDPLMRLSKVVNGASTSRFLYDGNEVVGEYNGAGSVVVRYTFGPGVDEPLTNHYPSSGRYWYHVPIPTIPHPCSGMIPHPVSEMIPHP